MDRKTSSLKAKSTSLPSPLDDTFVFSNILPDELSTALSKHMF